MRVLLVAEEMPERRDTGAFIYLHHFIEYCARRDMELILLVTGHRFERLLIRPRKIFPTLKVRIIGSDLKRIGPWSIVIDPRSWRHAVFAWIMRRGPRWLSAEVLRFRRTVRGHTAIIGRWLGAQEARRLAAAVQAANPDIMLVNTIFAGAILDIKPAHTRAAIITHDVFHLRTSAFEARGLRIRPAVTPAQEAQILRRFDAIIAISEEDAREFRRLAPDRPTVVVAPTAPRSTTLPRHADPGRCVFLGTSNALNVDGVSWFLSAVWPTVAATAPEARFELIGSVCNSVDAHDPTVIKRFVVEQVGPALAAASFAVNPLRAGSGLKIKMLDYFANGVPAISTSVGAAGFPRNGAEPFVVCDDAANFAATVLAWLRDPSVAARYAARCRAYVELFSRDSSFAELDGALGLVTG
jgi:hypothetical protein